MTAHESGSRERKGQPFAVFSHLPDSIPKQQDWEEENAGDTPIHYLTQRKKSGL